MARDSKSGLSASLKPALECLLNLQPLGHSRAGLARLMEYAEEEAETLNDLGSDHAGSLYHKVLPSAESFGAFYTKPSSAVLLTAMHSPERARIGVT